jgi:ribosome-associated toxin RatA of RatAB toxin-antitoxin module
MNFKDEIYGFNVDISDNKVKVSLTKEDYNIDVLLTSKNDVINFYEYIKYNNKNCEYLSVASTNDGNSIGEMTITHNKKRTEFNTNITVKQYFVDHNEGLKITNEVFDYLDSQGKLEELIQDNIITEYLLEKYKENIKVKEKSL